MANVQKQVVHTAGTVGALKLRFYATELVPADRDYTHAPALVDELDLIYIDEPGRFGLPFRHPVEELYPGIEVRYFAIRVQNKHMVQRGSVLGVPYTMCYNGTHGLFSVVVSDMGRNRNAPVSWKAGTDSPDPTARPEMQDVRVIENGRPAMWQNYFLAGWEGWTDGYVRYMWSDGSPVNLQDMHDNKKGKVRQSVLVPANIRGIGLAEQSVEQDALRQTISVMAWQLDKDWYNPISGSPSFNRNLKAYGADRAIEAGIKSRQDQAKFNHLDRLQNLDDKSRAAPSSIPTEDQFKVAAGSAFPQYQQKCPLSRGMFEPDPAVLMVFLPVHEDQLSQFFPELAQDAPQDGIIGF